jgi:hypothetical protein
VKQLEGAGQKSYFTAMKATRGFFNPKTDGLKVLQAVYLADPMKIGSKKDDGTGTTQIGGLLSKLVSLERIDSSSEIQSGLFSLYGSFAEYVAQRYDSDYKKWFEAVREELNGNSQNSYFTAMKATSGFFNPRTDGLKVLQTVGLADPMKIGCEKRDGTGTENIGGLLSKIVGMEYTDSSSKIQRGLFSLYGSFDEYVRQCYNNNYRKWFDAAKHLKKKSRASYFTAMKVNDGFFDSRIDGLKVLQAVGLADPMKIGSEKDDGTGIKNIGGLLSKIAGFEKTVQTSGLIQDKMFEQLYNSSIQDYFTHNGITPTSNEFIEQVAKKIPFQNNNTFYKALETFYKENSPQTFERTKEKSRMIIGCKFENFLYQKPDGQNYLEHFFGKKKVQRATLLNGATRHLDGIIGTPDQQYIVKRENDRVGVTYHKSIVEIKYSLDALAAKTRVKSNDGHARESSLEKYLAHAAHIHILVYDKKGFGKNYAGAKEMLKSELDLDDDATIKQTGNAFTFKHKGKYRSVAFHSIEDFKERAFGGNQADYKNFYQKAKEALFENESDSLQVT